jgi:hypothetical protein
MKLAGFIERGKIAATQMRQAITYKEQETEKGRFNIFLQILIALSLIAVGILLGYFFPVR